MDTFLVKMQKLEMKQVFLSLPKLSGSISYYTSVCRHVCMHTCQLWTGSY